jgi:hypothetical protein
MTARELAEAAFARAVQACALDRRVAEALAGPAPRLDGARRRLGIAKTPTPSSNSPVGAGGPWAWSAILIA